MTHLKLVPFLPLLVALGCKKPTDATPAVDPDAALHGTRPASAVPLIPDFRATNHDGTARTRDALVGAPTVMWFFPAANTGGCTVEGCGYRDTYADFQALGVQIVGVSFTDLETNHAWAVDQGFQYEIWRDEDRALAEYYGASNGPDNPYPKRRTKVLDAEGNLILEYNDKIIVGAHPSEVLQDVRVLLAR